LCYRLLRTTTPGQGASGEKSMGRFGTHVGFETLQGALI
jgi:hypothetical protein